MRRGSWLLVLAAFTVSCGGSVNVDRERSLLLEVDRQWSQSTRDVDKFVSYFTTDASVYPQGMPLVKGSGPIRETFIKMSSAPGFSLRWTPAAATVSTAGDSGLHDGHLPDDDERSFGSAGARAREIRDDLEESAGRSVEGCRGHLQHGRATPGSGAESRRSDAPKARSLESQVEETIVEET